jgi:hypothetical protein
LSCILKHVPSSRMAKVAAVYLQLLPDDMDTDQFMPVASC